MSKLRSFVVGVLFGCFIVGGVGYAANGFTIEVDFPAITYSVDDQVVDEIPTTIYYDGVTYAPVRFMADILGKEVIWHSENKQIEFHSIKQIDFHEVSYEDVNDEVKSWIDKSKKKRLAQVQHFGEETYILITRGSKSSGGYHVDIDRMLINDRGLWVYTRFTDPDKASMVTEEMTYPYLLVRLAEAYQGPVHFKEHTDRAIPMLNGVTLNEPIAFETDQLILFSPITNEGELTIRGAVLSFEGFMTVSLTNSQRELLTEQTVIADHAAPHWGKFDYTLPTVASPEHFLTLQWYNIDAPNDEDQLTIPLSELFQ